MSQLVSFVVLKSTNQNYKEEKTMEEMLMFMKSQNAHNDFWGYINNSSLEWACVSSRELSDGSIRQRMEAIDENYKYEFVASFYNGKCEHMYNWCAFYLD